MINYVEAIVLKNSKFHLLKFFMAFILMANLGCSYQQTHPVATIDIDLINVNEKLFSSAMQSFANEKGYFFIDSTRDYPSGMKPLLYELTNNSGDRILKVNDLMDRRRYVVAVYEVKSQDWKPLYESVFGFLKEQFPEASIEKKLVDLK